MTLTTYESILSIQADLIFNLIEWTGSEEDAAYQACKLIEKTGIPFTGADSACYRLISDKRRMKRAFTRLHIQTPMYQIFETGKEPIQQATIYPCIVKPAREHCSMGLSKDSVVYDQKTLRDQITKQHAAFNGPVLVEEFISGREIHVTVVEIDGDLFILPPAEIIFYTKGTDAFLTYQSRWDETHPDYQESEIRPAILSQSLQEKLVSISYDAFRKLSFRDYARMDIRVRDNTPYILEANCNPGLGDDEEYAITVSYKALGWTFADFISRIIASSLRRFSH